jgi:hypothetical protein
MYFLGRNENGFSWKKFTVDTSPLPDIMLPNMKAEQGPLVFDARSEKTLPDYLDRGANGQLWIKDTFVAAGERLGAYDYVFNFGTSESLLRGLVPEKQRLTENSEGLIVLGFEDQTIRQAMNRISVIANEPDKDPDSPADNDRETRYRGELAYVYDAMAREALGWAGDDVLVLTPKMGGVFVQEVFEKAGFAPEDFFDYRMSRVLRNDGGLMLGATIDEKNPDITKFRKFVIADDCLASRISTLATIMLIKKKYEEAKLDFSEVEILITVSTASQRGAESLLSQETKDELGFGSIKIVTGTLVYQMNDHFYLQNPDDTLAVGDMGKLTTLTPA